MGDKMTNIIDMKQIHQMIKDMVESTPKDLSPDVKQMMTAVLVTVYMQGWGDCLRVTKSGLTLMQDDLKKVHEEMVTLYNLKGE